MGATVLGNGRIAPILDVARLIEVALELKGATESRPVDQPAITTKRRILIAEDFITSIALLKNILESAHYEVQSAVDGIDALTKLKTGNFDLLVSDIDMP